MNMLLLALIIIICILLAFYIYSTIDKQNHWRKRGIKYDAGYPIIGSMYQFLDGKLSGNEFLTNLYNKFPKERCFGFFHFTQPFIFLRNIELIKNITVTNFDHFTDRSHMISRNTGSIWSNSLFSSEGERWKDLRHTLSPAFTSVKIRRMFTLMDECVQNMFKDLNNQNDQIVEVEDIFSRLGHDIIASTAFGIVTDSFKDQNNNFLQIAHDVVRTFEKNFLPCVYFPKIAKLLGIKLIRPTTWDSFQTIIHKAIKLRENNQNPIRHDLIDLMLLAREKKLKFEEVATKTEFAAVEEISTPETDTSSKSLLSEENITIQSLAFFFSGYETMAVGPSFLAYELALNPDIQSRLREEIMQQEAKCTNKLTYDDLISMKYMDMVISETLRKYPQGGFYIDRECTKDFVIKAEVEGETDIKVFKKDVLLIPVWAIHHDPNYFPEPDRFDPERFNNIDRKNIIAGSYLPFGIGPRNCIASRFSLMEIKILFYNMLKNFEILPTEKTQIPLKLVKQMLLVKTECNIVLRLKSIK